MRFQELMPDPLHWLGVTRIDKFISMSDMKYDAIVSSGIEIIDRIDIPDELIPPDAKASAHDASRLPPDYLQITSRLPPDYLQMPPDASRCQGEGAAEEHMMASDCHMVASDCHMMASGFQIIASVGHTIGSECTSTSLRWASPQVEIDAKVYAGYYAGSKEVKTMEQLAFTVGRVNESWQAAEPVSSAPPSHE